MGTILLYYKYVQIPNPIAIQKWQKELCSSLGLTGRILLAHEGINGTVGGSNEATQAYIKAMNEHPLFSDIDFKTAPGGAEAFPRMKISVKKEIVNLGVDPEQLTVKDTAEHLSPQEIHDLLNNPPQDLVIIDTRNSYEIAVGKFINAINPQTRYFRQFPQWIDENINTLKDKTVFMYCTGGVRCERATAYLNVKNIAKKVVQLEGGIHRYIEQFPDGHFRGKNYVFDNRITVRANDDILSKCLNCPTPSDEYYNCKNALCNKHFTSCPSCAQALNNTCSTQCHELVKHKQTPERQPFAKINKL
ncbi:rhodanese-related sulfurtransferase [Candidatus Dependentiae bacterium]|nr:rhodanese-related sulfurtransferase [Candidatus Dependentiae bacterium]